MLRAWTLFWALLTTLISTSASAQMRYYQADHLGSTALETNATGAVQQMEYYTPFGERFHTSHSTLPISRFQYTTQEFDAESDFYNYGARYYDPVLARFVSVDPGWDSLNRYEYARNNPIHYADPNGKNPLGFLIKSPDIVVASLFALYDSYQSAQALQEKNLGKALYHSIWAGLDLLSAADLGEPPFLGAVATVTTRAGGEAAMAELAQNPAVREWIAKIYGTRALAELGRYLGTFHNEDTSSDKKSQIPSQGWTMENYGKGILEELGDDFFPPDMETSQGKVDKGRVLEIMREIVHGTFDRTSYPIGITRTPPNGKRVVHNNLEVVVALGKLQLPIKGNVQMIETVLPKPEYLGEAPFTPPSSVDWKTVTWGFPKVFSF